MAREAIRLQFGKYNGDEHWGFDAVVLDIGTGEEGAEHLRGAVFYGELLELLTAGGVLLAGEADCMEILPGHLEWRPQASLAKSMPPKNFF